jgi:monoamine oxidase
MSKSKTEKMRDLNRRQFLQRSALAAAGVAIVPRRLPGNAFFYVQGSASPKRVVICGAGLAGMVAGYELSQLGHNVTILEARMRPGGRAHTLREPFSDGLYAEAGAARIPDNHDLTLKYIKLFDVPLEPMYPTRSQAVRLDGGQRRLVGPEGFTEALGQNFGSELGGNPTRWSKIKGGTDLFPKAFAERLADKIHYSAPVVRIEQDANSARAVFLHGGSPQTISADHVLCALPFSTLRRVELPTNFSARKRDIIQKLQYDSVSRVYLQAKTRFWEEKGLSGFAFTNEAVEIWQPTWSQPGPRGILMTYARPGEAERIASLKESERISSTLTQLDGIFPGLRENFEGGTSKVWMEDEWSRGAWSFVGPRDFVTASQAEGRIHFAGEHLSPFFSWMQGALQSGLHAVKEINEAA